MANVNAKVNLLINSGAVKDYNWPPNKPRANTCRLVQHWEHNQLGISITVVLFLYIDLKNKARHHPDVQQLVD
jgi:hypothetical protein